MGGLLSGQGSGSGSGGGGGGGDITGVTAGTGLSGGGSTGAVTIGLADTAVTPATYSNASITVDQQGRVTFASTGGAGSGNTTAINVKDAPYSATGDGTTDDTAAIQAAWDAAVLAGLPLYFPLGTYKCVQVGSSGTCFSITTSNARWFGDGGTLVFDSLTTNCITLGNTCTWVAFEGLKFQGSTTPIDSVPLTYSTHPSVYAPAGASEIFIDRCHFNQAQAISSASDTSGLRASRLTFTRNVSIDCPVTCTGGPNYSRYVDNIFYRSTTAIYYSHAIYCYGTCEDVIITGNQFYGHGDPTIEIRATSSHRQQKRNWIISNNHFEHETFYSMFLSNLGAELNNGTLVVNGNTFRNAGGIEGIGLQDAVISNNVFTWDYEAPLTDATAISVGTSFGEGSIVNGVTISNNRMVNRHPFLGIVECVDFPTAGDTVTVDTVTYTWRVTPALINEIEIHDTKWECMQNLAAALKGRNSGAALLDVGTVSSTVGTTVANVVIGSVGNSTTLAFVADGTGAGTLNESAFPAIVFHYESDVTTVANFEAAVTAATHISVFNPALSPEIILTSGSAFSATHLAKGQDVTPPNVVLRESTDAWYDEHVVTGTFKLWIASNRTFALSRTGTALTITAVEDRTGVLGAAISAIVAKNVLIEGNNINGAGVGITTSSCIAPVIRNNHVNIEYGAPIKGQGDVYPIYDGNTISFNRALKSVPLQAYAQLGIYSAFPVIRDSGLVVEQAFNGSVFVLPWLQGASGWTPVGDGKAHVYMFYGNEVGANIPVLASTFRWSDGAQLNLYNGDTEVEYQFFFKRVSPNGTTEFNSYSGLMALINSHTAGSWVATNPVEDYPGSTDTLNYGYIKITAGDVGVIRNQDSLNITQDATSKGPQTCGVYLRPWAGGGFWPGNDEQSFLGGAAEATCTVIYTPIASTNSPMFVQGMDELSEALVPKSYVADTIPGVGYVITHALASGTEKFFYKVG